MATRKRGQARPNPTPGRARILLIIEDPTLANVARLTLEHGNYEVSITRSVTEGGPAMRELKPHLVILDVDADDGRAMELIDDTEAADGKVPMIALTRRSDLRRQLEAFERGADDCMGIPFAPPDLAARVLAVLRRAYGKTPPAYRTLKIGDLQIDLVARQVQAAGAELHLTSLEQALLYLLASNAGTVLTREAIVDAIWGTDFLADSNIVDRHVRSLRVKLQNDWRKPKYIETVQGTGYRFRVDDTN